MHSNVLTSEAAILELCRGLRRVAVLGIKPESHADQPAHYVASYLARAGVEVVPVPVYYPDVTSILGRPVVRTCVDAGPVDLIDVFRRPSDIPPHLPDLLAARPKAVWFQLGIRNDAAALTLAQAGITVIQDRCLMVDHRRALASRA